MSFSDKAGCGEAGCGCLTLVFVIIPAIIVLFWFL